MPQIYTTGAFVSPEKRIIDGHEEWFWKVDGFEEDSFLNGEPCNPIEISKCKLDLLRDNLRRVQLLTIEGLLSKTQRAEHPDYEPDLNFKKAKTEANAAQKELGV